EDRNPSLELAGEGLAEAPDGGLARGVRRAPSAAWEIRRAAAGDDDPSSSALEHARDHGAAAEVDAEDVHLEDLPPLVRGGLPRVARWAVDARVRHEQVDLAELGHPALHVLTVRDVADERDPADLLRHRLDLLGRP